MPVKGIRGRSVGNPVLKLAAMVYNTLDRQPYTQYYKGNDGATFIPKLLQTSIDLAWKLAWLPKIVFHESSMDPTAKNPSGAKGLIQIMPSNYSWLNIPSDVDLTSVSGTGQLDYIKKYYKTLQKQHGQANSLEDAYLLTFFPAAVGQADDYVLGGAGTKEASTIAKQNSSLDNGNKGYLTKADIANFVNNF